MMKHLRRWSNGATGGHWGSHLKVVKAQGGEHVIALQKASFRGDKEVVQLLLDKGADVNAQGGMYGNAPQEASSRGDKEPSQVEDRKMAPEQSNSSARRSPVTEASSQEKTSTDSPQSHEVVTQNFEPQTARTAMSFNPHGNTQGMIQPRIFRQTYGASVAENGGVNASGNTSFAVPDSEVAKK